MNYSIPKRILLSCLPCLIVFAVSFLSIPSVHAKYGYFIISPDITANYTTTETNPGFVKISARLLIKNIDIESAELHENLFRSIIISIVSRSSEGTVQSSTGREEIRRKCLKEIKKCMQQLSGDEMVKDVIFTNFSINSRDY